MLMTTETTAASPAVPTFAAQRDYWDERWNRNPLPGPWSVRRGTLIIEWLRSLNLKTPSLLDYGCGTGWFTDELSKLGSAVGVDLSPEAIAAAQARYSGPTFMAANLFDLSLNDRQFDAIVSQEVIAHVVDPAEYVARITTMLKPGGFLVLTTANKTVMDRLVHPPDPEAHIKRWLGLRDLKLLLQPQYQLLRHTTIIPRGDRGFLRVANSAKLNAALRLAFSDNAIERFKERAGWGYTLLTLWRKREA
jgi:2-polyprenyl-3-methyl-5-hydroxy-6-metoxy-1,4-benzoquinol methylase